MFEFFMVYIFGVIGTIILIKLLNKTTKYPAPLDVILLLISTSWFGFLIYLVSYIHFFIEEARENKFSVIIKKLEKFFNTKK